MAQTLKALKITVLVDAKGAVKGIKTAKGEVMSLGTEAQTAGKKGKGFGSVFRGIGPMMIGTGAVIAGVTAILKKSITAAGDSAEVWSKFDAVFKEHSETARDWVVEFGGAIGRSQTDIAEWASTLQDTFVPMGLARDKAADLSMELVELAVDVASFNNKMDADVIRDFQSALVGNHETLRKYGVVITETTLKQEAINSRIWDGVGLMTEQEKIQARLNLIYAGTTDAQGDAVRTADSYNNSLKAMHAATQDMFVALGEKFLPVVTEVVQQLAAGARWITAWIKPLEDQKTKIELLNEELDKEIELLKKYEDHLADIETRNWVERFIAPTEQLTINIGKQKDKIEELKAAIKLADTVYAESINIAIRGSEDWRTALLPIPPAIDDIGTSFDEMLRESINGFNNFMGAVGQLGDNLLTLRKTQIQSEADDQIKAIMGSVKSEAWKANQITIIRDQAVLDEMEAAKKMKPLKYAQAVSNIALGVTKALSGLPPLSFIMAGLVAAAGAVEIATIRAQSAAGGMDQTLAADTVIMAHRGEDVKITPAGRATTGGQIVFSPQYIFNYPVTPETRAWIRRDVAPALEADARRLLNNLRIRS